MKCYDRGTLQAFLDKQVMNLQREEITDHLTQCAVCRETLQQLEETQTFTDDIMTNYIISLNNSNPGLAWDHLQTTLLQMDDALANSADRFTKNPRKGVLTIMKKYRGLAVAATVALAVTVSLSFAPVRAMAGDLLKVFRVNNLQTVSISPADLSQMQRTLRQGAGKVTLGNLGQMEMKRTGVSGGVTLDEAKASVDFPLLVPQALPPGSALKGYQRMAGSRLDFTLDTQKTNDVLKSFGASALLPDSINGKTFSAQIPVVISALYDGVNNLTITQTRSPELTAPSDTDINTIRDAVLALPFLPEDLRRQLASINDWQHTFVIPNVNGSTQTITVAGSTGVFITAPKDNQTSQQSSSNALLWQKSGVIYAITGNVTLDQGLSIANSMK